MEDARMRHSTVLALLALLALLLAAPAAAAKEQEIAAYLHDYFHIVPEALNAREGDLLKIQVQNAGQAPHDLFFCGDEDLTAPPSSCARPLGGPVAPAPGATLPLEVTVTVGPGTYWYYCTIPGHAAQGMAGKLTVQAVGDDRAVPGGGAALALAALAIGVVLSRRARP